VVAEAREQLAESKHHREVLEDARKLANELDDGDDPDAAGVDA
jgi:hypothetical protein